MPLRCPARSGLLAGTVLFVLAAARPAPASPVEDSVVKVFATERAPDPYRPWTKGAPVEVSGSGIVIGGRRILTNAHVVLYASEIQIQGNQSGDRLSATVAAIAPGIDLALLKLRDESFFAAHAPLPRAAALPNEKDPVLVYGFPTGGTSLSITKGIVSRIEFAGYNYPVSGLRIQIDAAINHGNSGGPAVVDGRMIGVAFSRLEGGAENIGYIIPSEEVDFFLRAVARGEPYEKPGMFDELQSLQNPALRAFLGAGPAIRGMVVTRPDEDAPDYPLKRWDVITRIGSTPVDDEGMVRITDLLRVSFRYLIQHDTKGGRVPLTVYRQGRLIPVSYPVRFRRPLLIPNLDGKYPSYFVFGPVVFSAATAQFMAGLNSVAALSALDAMGSPLAARRGGRPSFPGEQVVVISSPFFPSDLVRGYDDHLAAVVKTVNGTKIRNLGQLVAFLRDCRDPFLRFEFAERGREALVFRRQELLDSAEGILSDNDLRSQGSPDMMAIWNAKPSPGS